MNPQRTFLAAGYKNALRNLVMVQGVFLSVIKRLESKSKGNEKLVKPFIESLKKTTDSIANVINQSSNKEIIDGKVFGIASQISGQWLRKDTELDFLVTQAGLIDQLFIDHFQKEIKAHINNIYTDLNEADKSKGMLNDSIRSQDWKGLVGGSLSVLEHLIPGGNVLKHAGNFAYNIWEKGNKASYARDENTQHSNLNSTFGGQSWNDSGGGTVAQASQPAMASQPTFNNQGTGGTSGGGGGWAGGINANFTPNGKGSKWKDAVSGKFMGAGAIEGSWGSDPLFKFFNTGAYFAGWTKDVLKALRDIKGGNVGSSPFGFLKDLMSGLGRLLPMLGTVLAVAGAAFVGWKAGRWLGENVKWGGKTLDQHTQDVESGGFQAIDKLSGKYNFTSKDRQLLDQQRGVAGMSASQMAQLNTELRERAKLTSSNHTATTVAILHSILEETKKSNTKKSDDKSIPTASSTQRPIHRDIGDITTELLNTGSVGNPRR